MFLQLHVSQKRAPRLSECRAVVDEDNEYHVSSISKKKKNYFLKTFILKHVWPTFYIFTILYSTLITYEI